MFPFRSFVILSLLVFAGCKAELIPLCSPRFPNFSPALRTNGYYYSEWETGEKWDVLFFNSNGIVLLPFFIAKSDSSLIMEKLQEDGFYGGGGGHALDWGIFHITNSTIVMEKWYPSNRLVPGVNEGQILNDSTFVFNFFYQCDHSDFHLQHEVWHFKNFEMKPDSICDFID
jgi:hypothetical protein